MPASPARIAAFDILLRVGRDHAYAAEIFNSAPYTQLSSPDHRLAMDLVNGVQRWRALLDTKIASVSTVQLAKLDLEVLTALRIAAYQLTFLDRVPSRAAVNESVELVKRARKRSAVPFVNAVLRKLSGAQNDSSISTVDGAMTHLAESFSHPRWLVDRWIREFGSDVARTICEYDQQVPEVSIRLNGSSSENRTLENQLAEDGIRLTPGRLLTSARQVLAGDITNTSAFRKGLISIQDEGSQLVAFLVGKASRILDCCAAPGGKTRILAQRNPNGNILAVELHPHRARLLTKLVPMSNVEVITADVRNLPINAFFERVLVDVPCSGTGTLARNPEIKWRLTPEDLSDFQQRQVQILRSAMNRVTSGGRLVYSTCSLEPEENTAVIDQALASDKSFQLMPCAEELDRLCSDGELALSSANFGSIVRDKFLQVIPGRYQSDGFFAAILQKN